MTDYRVILSHNGRTIILADAEEPGGLRDINVELVRHPKFHGMMPELTTALSFHSSGYDFISSAYNELGLNANINCVIEFKDYRWNTLFDGTIDLSDIKWTHRFVECEIKSNPCLDLFLNRLGQSVNLYDEPCFNELTSDLENYRTRYRFAPYSLEIPQVDMTFVAQWKTPATNPGVLTRRFGFVGGTGCTLFLCDGGAVPCGYSTSCDNLDSSGNVIPVYLTQALPIDIVLNDLDLLTSPFIESIAMQDIRDCGFGLLEENANFPQFFRTPFDISIENIGTAGACTCHNYNVDLDVEVSASVELIHYNGYVEWVRVTPELWFLWGETDGDGNFSGYSKLLTSGTPIEGDGVTPCNPYSTGGGTIYSIGSESVSYTGSFDIDSCTGPFPDGRVANGYYMGVYVRYQIAGSFNDDDFPLPQNGGKTDVSVETTLVKNNGTVTSKTCSPNPPIGNTTCDAYFLHEAFSRLTEHYTNNCLRVKSNFFGRPNSLEWGDNADAQCPSECGGYPFYPAGNPCSTFDLTDYQPAQAGCGGHVVITNGRVLRNFGTEMFVSFDELFDAANAVFAIGLGWSADDPDNIRIENWEYFYEDNIILDLGAIDLYNSKYERTPSEHYINKFSAGYTEWLTDLYNTKDVIHSTREYTLPIKNVKNSLEKQSEFIADHYALEWQRRQGRYSTTGSYDDKKFFICVGRGTDLNNTIQINTDIGPVTYPNHIFIAEQGVDNPDNQPYDILNYRIAPSNIVDRWAEWLGIGLWTESGVIAFAKGEANFKAGGDNIYTDCETDKNYFENDPINIRCARIFPEIIKFEYPLTPYQYHVIRTNPYGTIIVNKEEYFLISLTFKPNNNSTIKLLKKKRCNS